MIRPRLAGYDTSGFVLLDTDVLSDWELAEDRGWITPRREHVPIDPALVDEVARLQGGGRRG